MNQEDRIAKLEGQVRALGYVSAQLLIETFRNTHEQGYRILRLNLALKKLREDYSRIPFMLPDEVAEGFRDMLDQISAAFDEHDDTPLKDDDEQNDTTNRRQS